MDAAPTPIATLKPEALHAFIVARLLFEKARETCFVDERHTASAGLTILQDALELALHGFLIQLGVDERRSIDNLKFDELLGLVRSEVKDTIPKSGTLRALNKQRNLIKHAGQLAEPATVRSFYENAFFSIDSLLTRFLGRGLQSVAMSEMAINAETKRFIGEAERLIADRQYFHSLAAIRKVLFIEILEAYAIDGFASSNAPRIFSLLSGRGVGAPYYTRNPTPTSRGVRRLYLVVCNHRAS
jgi:hypothetical protein